MSVTEVLMKLGSWSVRLREDTPQSVRDAIDFFGHVVITPTRVNPTTLGDAAVLSLARYSGVVMSKSRRELGGPGMAWWMGDDQGKGPVIESYFPAHWDFETWVSTLAPDSLNLGTITNVSPSLALFLKVKYLTPRAAIDKICAYFGGEWRISPAATLDAGPASALFETTPHAVVLRRDAADDFTLDGLQALELDKADDVEDYASKVLVVAEGEGSGAAEGAAGGATPYTDMLGGGFLVTKVVDAPDLGSGDADDFAAAELARVGATREAVSLSADVYDIGRKVAVGDNIYVYDPEIGLFDTTNEVTYRGRKIWPSIERVLAYTWPVDARMGVFFRAGDATYTDLTPWIEAEQGGTKVEVGAALRRPTAVARAAMARLALVERISR